MANGIFAKRSPLSPEIADPGIVEKFLESGCVMIVGRRVILGWGRQRRSAASGVSEEPSFYVPDFYLGAQRSPWMTTEFWGESDVDEFRRILSEKPGEAVSEIEWQAPPRESFDKKLGVIREGRRSRGVKKAVPVEFEKATHSVGPARLRAALLSALSCRTEQCLYGTWNAEDGGFLGISPELLFERTRAGHLETVALAGTRPKFRERGDDTSAFLADPKERFEHRLVIEDLCEKLSGLGAKLEVSETRVVELPTMFHLKTKLAATFSREVPFEALAATLHPSAALGVYPSALGEVEMRRWDDADERGAFGAPFGLSFAGLETCWVGIRNFRWKAGRIEIGSGCGIVEASRPDDEWRELAAKRDSVKRAFGL